MDIFSNSTSVYGLKNIILMDGEYWQKGLKELNIKTINLDQIIDKLSLPAYRIRTKYYDVLKQDQQNLQKGLPLAGRFEMQLADESKETIVCPNCKKQGKIKLRTSKIVTIATDIMYIALKKQVDILTLITDDEHYVQALELAKKEGIVVKIAYFKNKKNEKLLKLADETIDLTKEILKTDNSKKLEIQTKEKNKKDGIQGKPLNPEKILKEIKNMFIEKNTQELTLSFLGRELNSKYPNWRENYKNKTLKEILKGLSKEITIEKKGTEEYVQILGLGIGTYTGRTFEELVKETMMTVTKNNSKPVALIELGNALSKKEQLWKKKYKIKLLKKELEKMEGYNIINTNGIDYVSLQKI